jgi:Icc-related predicted phosphoesterase
MRILAIGDFHGKFPAKLKKLISRYEYDVIISQGDFRGNKKLVQLYFKHRYGKEDETPPVWEIIGLDKWMKYDQESEEEGRRMLTALKDLNKPLYVVTGNHDRAGWRDIGQKRKEADWPNGYDTKETIKFIQKLGILNLDFAKKKFQGFDLIGYPRSSYPGLERKRFKYTDEARKRRQDDWDEHKRKLEKLFTRPNKTIFVPHNVPYKTKLDKVAPSGHELARNRPYGSALVKELIKKYQPRLVIAGHIHENPGKIRIGKTVVVNPGAAVDGRAALITLTDKQVKVKFLKA